MRTRACWITLRWKRNSRASSGVRSTWFPSAQSSAARIGFGASPSWRARSHTLPRDDANLLDILKAARLAIEFKGSADKAAFLTDAKTQSAVLHQLLVEIG